MQSTLLLCGLAALSTPALAAQQAAEDTIDHKPAAQVISVRGVCGSGETATLPWNGTTGQAGNMFDIIVTADMTIECLDVHLAGALPADLEIWTCPTTVIGNEVNPAAWTLLASAPGTQGMGIGLPTPVDISGNGVVFSAGQSYGVYIFSTNYTSGQNTMWYTSGSTGLYMGDHCDVQTHHGAQANWAGIYSPREWNGILYTELAGPAGPTLSVVGQCGQPGSGVQATNMTPNGLCGFAASPSNAGISVPAGPCGQVALGIGQPLFVVGFANADGNGTATVLPGNGIPSVACGWNMQSIDLASCALTNVVVL